VSDAAPVRIQSLSRRALAVAPVRLVLGGAGVAAAIAAGSSSAAALLAFAAATIGLLVVVAADPRRLFFRMPDDPAEAPGDALEDGTLRLVWTALFPSTAGLMALLAVSLAFEPTLAAVMAGILAGLGIAALVGGLELLLRERTDGRRLFVVRGTQHVVVRVRLRERPDA
jgi:hypothetical protein